MTLLAGLPPEVGAAFERVLGMLQQDLAADFGGAIPKLQPINFEDRLFSRVLRVRAEVESEQPSTLYVKVYKVKSDRGGEEMRERVIQDFAVTRRVAEAMHGHRDLGVVRAVACYADELAIVTEEVCGQTLRAYLDDQATWFPSRRIQDDLEQTLCNVGRWLRAFQAIQPGGAQVSVTGLRDYVDIRLKRLTEDGLWSTDRRQRLLDHLERLGQQVDPKELDEVIVHADLAPGNILVSKGCVTVIDLGMVQRGSALHDISRLYLQLDVLRAKPQFRSAVVDTLQRALLRGYEPALRPDRPLFRLLLLLHRVNHLSTLSFARERFPASLLSRQVLRLHRGRIAADLQLGGGHRLS